MHAISSNENLSMFSAVGPLGACMVISGKGYNLGFVQSSPQLVEDGSISIVYQNGDVCHASAHYSTRIILECDDNPVSFTRAFTVPTSSLLTCLTASVVLLVLH